jgi:hypothetical protein
VCDAYAEAIDSLCEIGLVVPVRHDDLGRSSAGGHGRCISTAVVDNGDDTREERLQIDL